VAAAAAPSADPQAESSAASPTSATRPRKRRASHGASAKARSDAAPPESAPVEAAADGVGGEANGAASAEADASTDGTGGEGTSGELGGEGGSGGDSLQARALAAYRERLIRWFSARFHVRGSGLGSALLSLRARAEVEISEGGVVLGYRVLSADHPALEAAAREALDAVLGEPLPTPPDFFPGAPQRRLRITFVCTESTCD
ncbi:MAG: hypothetical protein KC486_29065, partial [Myxococcales bacterium]|nr:hypothetical protein [Myxococcales bacterium]